MAIDKDKSTESNQQYWTYVEETSREVEKWPAWLRCGAEIKTLPEKENSPKEKDEQKK